MRCLFFCYAPGIEVRLPFLLLLVFCLACQNKTPEKEPQTRPQAAPQKTFIPSTEDHPHAPIFNGDIHSTAEHNHIELYVGRDGLAEVYLYDNAVNPVPAKEATGYLEVYLKGGPQKFTLRYGAPDNHDQLSAQLPKDLTSPIQIFVHAELQKVIYEASFLYNVNEHPDRVAHMHDARQGGLVAMIGESTHVEMVWVKPGEYRVYLSDMMRGPLPPTAVKAPSLEIEPDSEQPEKLPLTIDPTGTFLQAFGKPTAKDPLSVRVWVTLKEKPEPIDYFLPAPK